MEFLNALDPMMKLLIMAGMIAAIAILFATRRRS